MKKILITICAIFIAGFAHADTIDINWLNEDGTTYDTSTCTVGGDVILPTTPTKYGYTFAGWARYIPIEYIESTGTQYINTGFSANQDTRAILESKIITMANHDNFIFGTRINNYTDAFNVTILGSKSTFRSDYGTNEAFVNIANVWNHKLKFDKDKNILLIYNETNTFLGRVENTEQTFTTKGAILLPGGISKYPSTFLFDGTIQIYSFQLYDNNVLVRDFIPVLDLDGVACMFDKVEGKFYYNAGTGDFIAGPAITE